MFVATHCDKRIEDYFGYDSCDWFWGLLFSLSFSKYRLFIMLEAYRATSKQSPPITQHLPHYQTLFGFSLSPFSLCPMPFSSISIYGLISYILFYFLTFFECVSNLFSQGVILAVNWVKTNWSELRKIR